ncbi:helix-turn-helix domain-containing protein [Arthrobacter pigmenti]
MNYHEVLRANVGAELGRRDITQTAAAAAVGLPQSSFSARLAGRSEFKLSELLRLAAFLQIPLSTLVQGVDFRNEANGGMAG